MNSEQFLRSSKPLPGCENNFSDKTNACDNFSFLSFTEGGKQINVQISA